MTLFKFCTASGGAKILETRSIFITSPLDLNDPFEMRPAWTDAHSERHHQDLEQRNKMFAGSPLFVATTDGKKPAGLVPHMREPDIVPVANQLGIADMHNEMVFRELHRRYRVLCFSSGILDDHRTEDESAKDILMWAHYAESFQGVCIGVDPTKFENGLKSGGFEVRYPPKRVELPPSFYDIYHEITAERVKVEGQIFTKDPDTGLFLTGPQRKQVIENQFISLLSHKSPVWKYEQEVRMIYDLEETQLSQNYYRPTFACGTCRQPDCAHQTYRDAIRLPAEAVTLVILGPDISRKEALVILDLLASSDFKHVSVYWCSLHSEKYTLQYNEDRMTNEGRYSAFMQSHHEKQVAEAKGHIRYHDKVMSYTPAKKTVLYDTP